MTESFNRHVRYGAAMAVGVACAGTALPSAVSLLEKMMKDPEEIVRQGVYIALGMVLMQESPKSNPKAKAVRAKYLEVRGKSMNSPHVGNSHNCFTDLLGPAAAYDGKDGCRAWCWYH